MLRLDFDLACLTIGTDKERRDREKAQRDAKNKTKTYVPKAPRRGRR